MPRRTKELFSFEGSCQLCTVRFSTRLAKESMEAHSCLRLSSHCNTLRGEADIRQGIAGEGKDRKYSRFYYKVTSELLFICSIPFDSTCKSYGAVRRSS